MIGLYFFNQLVYDPTRIEMIWLKYDLNQIASESNNRKTIQLGFVFESTWFWFYQEENDPSRICVWINLFLIWPRGKLSDSILCLNKLSSDPTKSKMIQLDGIYF